MKSRKGIDRTGILARVALACGCLLGLAGCSEASTPREKPAPAAKAPAAAPASSPVGATGTPASATPAPSMAETAAQPAPVAQAPNVCGGQTFCYEAVNFAATVTGFRTSVAGGYRVIDATVRFQNKSGKALILGYALNSGVAVDEKGNRYVVGGPNGYRGIGYVNGQSFDPKFVLLPGNFLDARFELSWAPGNAIVGSTFELDLTVNEINTVEGNQHTLGGEFPMEFRGLANEVPGTK